VKITHCRDSVCGVPLVSAGAGAAPPGMRRHTGRGLCSRCHYRHRRDGTLEDFPPLTWTREELYAEWAVLRDGGTDARTAADRIGVSFAALEKAIHRTERGDVPPVTRPPRRSAAEILDQWHALLGQGLSRRQARRRMRVCRKTIKKVLAGTGQEL